MSKRRKKKPVAKREKLEVTVRPAGEKDGLAVFKMAEQFHASLEDAQGTEFDHTAVGRLIAKIIVSPDHDVLLAFNGSETPLGMAAMMTHPSHFSPSTKMANELAWWVTPEARKKGVGDQLLQAVIEWAREKEVSVLTMIALKNSQGAARQYLNKGFRLLESTYAKRL